MQTHCPTCKRRFSKSDNAKAFQKAIRKERRAEGIAQRLSTREIRAACMERCQGFCEASWRPRRHTWGLVMDHWEGGSGRRKENQSVLTCWMLCRGCNAERTHNSPSAEHWNEVRKAFCDLRDYPFTPHVEHQPLPRKGMG